MGIPDLFRGADDGPPDLYENAFLSVIVVGTHEASGGALSALETLYTGFRLLQSRVPSYISTRVTTPCNLLAGNLLNWTKLGVSFLITEKAFQTGLVVSISSMP